MPSQAAIIQVRQDFERIQAVYNRIVLAISDNRLPEYGLILDATGEIRKCANRLKKHLALPALDDKGESKEKADLKEEEIRPSLQMLCLHIAKFVTNPVFETAGVIDVEQSAKASKDLEEIIEISEVVWRSTEKLAGAKK
ncbi:MAG TPA: hypothetical protein VFQ92_17790 [Blastocatellia bacterium]|nr:hypothetical protein [Blastocatellia bacterium]